MSLDLLGEHPFACDAQGNLKSRIGTIFLRRGLLVTLPGIHATQRLAYSDWLNAHRYTHSLPPLSPAEEAAEWEQSVDLIMEHDTILIRPDPEHMDFAFIADEMLQELVSKRQIRFLNVLNEQVRAAIKQRGECWRISPLPQSADEMERMIAASRAAIANQPIYHYSMVTGTQFLTCQDFAKLAGLAPAFLAAQLQEIRDYASRKNRLHQPEVAFFGTGTSFGVADFPSQDLVALEPQRLAAIHQTLNARFQAAVSAELREDNPKNLPWRNRMFSALIGQGDKTVADEILRGLSPEFFMQIRWLPGGRLQDGELIFDSIFDEQQKTPSDPKLAELCDEKTKGFIFNFIREFGDIEYVNIGRVISSLTQRTDISRRRGVYIAEVKPRDRATPVARILRMQKWDIAAHLDAGRSFFDAIMQSEEYIEYVLDRRLGCRQLGMNIRPSLSSWRLRLPYRGTCKEYEGQIIWYTYFERDYISGVATDKISPPRFQSPEFALRFARLLGRAAAPSLIAGKADAKGRALFDDGDEVLLEDAERMPVDIVISDHTGTFVNYNTDFLDSTADYAQPVNRRAGIVPDPAAFADAYLEAFVEQFVHLQQKYRSMKRGYQTLFSHRNRDERGSFAYRWEKVLDRLDRADARFLAANIRKHFRIA